MLKPDAAPTEEAPDVISPGANAILAGMWVLLFAFRGLAVPPLVNYGVLPGAMVAAWDVGPLLWCYVVLLIVTVVIVALRAVRGAESPRSSSPPVRKAKLRD